jgi:hypothetical protein
MKSWALIFILIHFCFSLNSEAEDKKPVRSSSNFVNNSALVAFGNVVITTRQVELSNIIEHWRVSKSAPSPEISGEWAPALRSPGFQEALGQLVTDLMLEAEAPSESRAISQEAFAIEKDKLMRDLKNWEPWQAMAFTGSDVDVAMKRSWVAADYLAKLFELKKLSVSDSEIKVFYEDRKNQFEKADFEFYSEGIGRLLRRRQAEVKIKEWIDTMKLKYKVRLLDADKL